jgi:hypothetical protein
VDAVGDNYCMMGIYNDKQCNMEVEMMEPETESMKGTLQAMRNKGVKVYFTHNRYTSINLGITNLK